MLKKGRKIELASNGPFVTGCDYSSHLLLTNGYAQYRSNILENLEKRTSKNDGWFIPRLRTRCGMGTNKQSSTLPHVLIARHLDRNKIEKGDYGIILDFYTDKGLKEITYEKQSDSTMSYHITSIEVRITEFGCGYVMVTGEIKALDDVSFALIREFSKNLCPLIREISPLIIETIDNVNKACPQSLRMDKTILGALPGITSEKTTLRTIEISQEIGQVVNTPRIFRIPCDTQKEFNEMNKIARQLLISDSEDYVPNSSLSSDDLTIYTGHGSSVALFNTETVPENVQKSLIKTHAVMNFFYFMTEKLTSNLFFLNNSLNLASDDSDSNFLPKTAELEKETNAVIEYKAQIDYFLARYKSYDNDLDPQSLRIWRDIEKLWEASDRFDALEDQLKTTDSIYTRLHNNLSRVYNKRIGTFLMFFTLLSMLSVIVDTVVFTQEEGLVMPSLLRLVVLVGMASLFIFLAFLVSRRK